MDTGIRIFKGQPHFFVPVFLFLLACLSACETRDGDYFNGTVTIVDTNVPIDTLSGYKLNMEVAPGWLAAADSMAFFHTLMEPESFLSVYNYLSGKHLGNFFLKGNGPSEFISLSKIYQLINSNGKLQAIQSSPARQEIVRWNITASLAACKTVCSSPFSFKDIKDPEKPPREYYAGIFAIDSLHYLLGVPLYYVHSDGEKYPLKMFQKVNIKTGQVEREYSPYRKPITVKNPHFYFGDKDYYGTSEILHPGGKKLFMAMISFAQVNILDLETGRLDGFRLKGAPGFREADRHTGECKSYYLNSAADEHFTYSLFADAVPPPGEGFPPTHWVHVFDWNGRLVKKLYLQYPATQIAADSRAGYLVTKNDFTDEIYYYPLKRRRF